MCGRFTLSAPGEVVGELFELAEVPTLSPRYNVAPTQPVAAVLLTRDAVADRRLTMLRWGLVPSWADDPGIGARLINARAETAASKPAFRAALRSRRCLVVADGFYEWKKTTRKKQPYYIRMLDRAPFAFAGLWERWEGPDGSAINSCTLLTTEPSDLIRPLHNRMPVILEPRHYSMWLGPADIPADTLPRLLGPFPTPSMTAYPVSTLVNDPANDSPRCIEPLA